MDLRLSRGRDGRRSNRALGKQEKRMVDSEVGLLADNKSLEKMKAWVGGLFWLSAIDLDTCETRNIVQVRELGGKCKPLHCAEE